MESDNLIIKVERKSYIKRILPSIFIFILFLLISVLSIGLTEIEPLFANYPIETISICILICFLFSYLIYIFNASRYQIIEIFQDGEKVNIRFLLRNKEFQKSLELKKIRMLLGTIGKYGGTLKLIFYEGDSKICHQISRDGWTKEMIKDVYRKFYEYNKIQNSCYIKL